MVERLIPPRSGNASSGGPEATARVKTGPHVRHRNRAARWACTRPGRRSPCGYCGLPRVTGPVHAGWRSPCRQTLERFRGAALTDGAPAFSAELDLRRWAPHYARLNGIRRTPRGRQCRTALYARYVCQQPRAGPEPLAVFPVLGETLVEFPFPLVAARLGGEDRSDGKGHAPKPLAEILRLPDLDEAAVPDEVDHRQGPTEGVPGGTRTGLDRLKEASVRNAVPKPVIRVGSTVIRGVIDIRHEGRKYGRVVLRAERQRLGPRRHAPTRRTVGIQPHAAASVVTFRHLDPASAGALERAPPLERIGQHASTAFARNDKFDHVDSNSVGHAPGR